jgi:proteasome lid subunit RPN8/RPN11
MTFSIVRTIRTLIFPPRPLMCRRRLWADIVSELRERGRGNRESGGFLLGRRDGTARSIEAFLAYDAVDPDALRGHIEFDGSRMDLVWSECRRRGLQVIADVHTHPGSPGQSDVDRANPMIPERGHVALIIPNFARKLYLPGQVGIYEFRGRDGWVDHSRKGSRFFAVRRFA